ncbi:uncharacterized protein RAG0_01550 [Rhynchosporium agropyri]|uniref:PLC-like phosphodiesterase n=1 Tax=Rhynchosporium agropyri TaxID=914238 RepID=A0A1E1JXA0_9HELO|nr:uncharacterized protein RAG0_01550 [Rhynchosporium agropyri]
MRFTSLLRAVICLLLHAIFVSAGPGGYVQLANLTPYDWKLKSIHSYHMRWDFRDTIPAGTAKEQYFEWKKDHGPNGDCGAEATYELVGSPEPASFTVQARQNNGKHIDIQYGDALSSLGNPVGSLFTLGYTKDGTVLFVLAGNETGSYVSSNPPVAWMQATFPTIGQKSLREIAMPASHDAGMSQITRIYYGTAHNTQTQSVHVYRQLIYGARWFDIRPAHRQGTWSTNHLFGKLGAFGRTIHDIIEDVNRFTAEHPGELIVLDLTHEMERLRWRPRLTAEKWQELYDLLYNGLDDIWMAYQDSMPEDLSAVPISTFVQPGSRSAVLVRIPDHAPEDILRSSAVQKRDIAMGDALIEDGSSKTAIDERLDVNVPIEDGYSNTAIDVPLDINAPNIVPGDCPLEESDDENAETPDNSTLSPLLDFPLLPPPKPPTVLKPAFIHAQRLATAGEYSDTDSPSFLELDQLLKLARLRPEPKSRIHKSTWTITQRTKDVIDIGNSATSIISKAVPAHRRLFSMIWKGLKGTTYPNLIEVDDIHDSQVTALCVAVNHYFGRGLDMAGVKILGKRRMVMIKGRSAEEGKSEKLGWLGKGVVLFANGLTSAIKNMNPRSCLTERWCGLMNTDT